MSIPVFGDNGSSMHLHFSIWKDGKPTFSGNQYADLSESCLYFIGGVIKHANADHEFLTKGNVFSVDQIESYLDLKQEEQDRYRMTSHLVEHDMYYSY